MRYRKKNTKNIFISLWDIDLHFVVPIIFEMTTTMYHMYRFRSTSVIVEELIE